MIKWISTRGDKREYTAAQGIIAGLADDKGLLVPDHLPEKMDIAPLVGKSYQEISQIVLGKFFTDFTEEELEFCVKSAYDQKFDTPEIAPLVKAGKAHFLELYHGKTSAFKDMALSILPYLLLTALKKENEKNKICILTATSGDTGKAALEGFADVEGTEIIVFYPEDGVSEVQKQQMVTQSGKNTHVFAIKGNFDDAQTGVKQIFNDNEFNKALNQQGVKLSSANSINIGRLVPQVAYYVHAYCQMAAQGALTMGEPMNVVVPTGNFGNILAAYYAKEIGVPVNKFICASNENKVLTDFFETGCYDTRREFRLTNSPSMDILISSNLERLLALLEGNDSEKIAALMKELDEKKYYEFDKAKLCEFAAGYANVLETNETIKKMFVDEGYLIDTHTAVAYKVYKDYVKRTGDEVPAVIASTASCYKFAKSVADSIGIAGPEDGMNGFEYIKAINKATKLQIPEGLKDLDKKEVCHKDVIEKDDMRRVTLESL